MQTTKTMVHPSAIRLLTDATWDFAHRNLWCEFPFSEAEIALSKLYIKEYYNEIPAEKFTEIAHKLFTAYCERILLAKEYVSRFSHRYIPHPCLWLNRKYPKGFAGTKQWYLRNQERKKECSLCANCEKEIFLNPIFNHFHFKRA